MLYWLILLVSGHLVAGAAGAGIGPCWLLRPDFERSSFVAGRVVIGEGDPASATASGLRGSFRVEVLANDLRSVRGVDQSFQIIPASRATGGRLQHSWHGPILQHPEGLSIPVARIQVPGGDCGRTRVFLPITIRAGNFGVVTPQDTVVRISGNSLNAVSVSYGAKNSRWHVWKPQQVGAFFQTHTREYEALYFQWESGKANIIPVIAIGDSSRRIEGDFMAGFGGLVYRALGPDSLHQTNPAFSEGFLLAGAATTPHVDFVAQQNIPRNAISAPSAARRVEISTDQLLKEGALDRRTATATF